MAYVYEFKFKCHRTKSSSILNAGTFWELPTRKIVYFTVCSVRDTNVPHVKPSNVLVVNCVPYF